MEEKQIVKVVKDHQQWELRLEQGGLDLASIVVGEFVVACQECGGTCHSRRCCPDMR